MDFREYKAKMAVVAELIANYKKADAIGIDNNKTDARAAEIVENFVEKDVDNIVEIC